MTKRYSPKLKFQVVMEALRGDKSMAQVAKAYNIHPNTVRGWKKEFVEKGPELFGQDGMVKEYEQRIAELEQLVGKKEKGHSLFLEVQNLAELVQVIDRRMTYYNTDRRHSTLGYVAPMVFVRQQEMSRAFPA